MSEKLTPAELTDIRERWEKATKGPYREDLDVRSGGAHQVVHTNNGKTLTLLFMATCGDVTQEIHDVEFLSASWEDTRRLLAHIAFLEGERDRLYQEVVLATVEPYEKVVRELNETIEESERLHPEQSERREYVATVVRALTDANSGVRALLTPPSATEGKVSE